MGSRRLPGKVLLPVGGQPTIEWVFRRTKAASTVTEVVIATSGKQGDDVLADHCLRLGWPVFRGSETDVLDRYHEAAHAHGAETVVRVSGDCPMVDPSIIDRIVRALWEKPAVDYASNILEPRTFPRGLDVEAFTIDALVKAWAEDANPAWREHVTPYIYRNPDKFRMRQVKHDVDLSSMRWTLDTPEDLEFLRRLLAEVSDLHASWREALEISQDHRDWLRLNSDVVQKEIE